VSATLASERDDAINEIMRSDRIDLAALKVGLPPLPGVSDWFHMEPFSIGVFERLSVVCHSHSPLGCVSDWLHMDIPAVAMWCFDCQNNHEITTKGPTLGEAGVGPQVHRRVHLERALLEQHADQHAAVQPPRHVQRHVAGLSKLRPVATPHSLKPARFGFDPPFWNLAK
jgi:hypothetical protein